MMTRASLVLLLIVLFFFLLTSNDALKTCFKSSNEISYLFVDPSSSMKIPLIPSDCHLCQMAEQVQIHFIDEQRMRNRTIQRLTILLRNFEIEDSTYICLVQTCPIFAQHGSDSIVLNVTSTLFPHAFLSFTYDHGNSQCQIQTRFSLVSRTASLTCTERIFLHPRYNHSIFAQTRVDDCRALDFEHSIYRSSFQFHYESLPIQPSMITIKSTDQLCRFLVQNVYLLRSDATRNSSLIKVNILPLFNPWDNEPMVLEPCRTEFVPFEEMYFTDDVGYIRTIQIESGQTLQLRCPIDGSQSYLKYAWYYQRYQSKYQISANRTIHLTNLTEDMQGKYLCVADDNDEKLEFEMTLQVFKRTSTRHSFYFIVISSVILIFLIVCLGLIATGCYLFRVYLRRISPLKSLSKDLSCSTNDRLHRPHSFTVHHDVLVTIQHSSTPISEDSPRWKSIGSEAMDYIDAPTNSSPWLRRKPSTIAIGNEQIPCRYSTRHLDLLGHYRNINGQPLNQQSFTFHLPISSSAVQTSIPISVHPSVNLNDSSDEMKMLKITVPYLTTYPLLESTRSIVSFDSEIELNEFNRMSSLLDGESTSMTTNNQCKQNT